MVKKKKKEQRVEYAKKQIIFDFYYCAFHLWGGIANHAKFLTKLPGIRVKKHFYYHIRARVIPGCVIVWNI